MELAPLIVTLKTALAATAVTFWLGIFLAYRVARMQKFRGLADAVITLPLVLPPTVVGFFLILFLGKRSAVGQFPLQFDVSLVFTWEAAVISAALGVPERKIFWRIILPNVRAGILAGTVLAFTRSLGEFGATIMFAGNIPGVTQTMSTAIYSAVQANDYDLAFQWAAALIIFSLVFVLVLNSISR